LNPKESDEDGDLNDKIGKVLRYGVVSSASVAGAGLVLLLLTPPPEMPSSIQGVLAVNLGGPALNPASLAQGLVHANPVSFLQLGTLILLATPIARVAASVLLFLREGDTLRGHHVSVLAMLLSAIFVVGSVEA
jgi:uncharacterized membrane protein